MSDDALSSDQFSARVRAMLEDRRLSRAERRALGASLADAAPSEQDRSRLLNVAFDTAAEQLGRAADRQLLLALHDLCKVVMRDHDTVQRPEVAESWFSPRQDLPRRLGRLIGGAGSRIDLCIFTVTDDSLSQPLLDARKRGVQVRLITDDLKSMDPGSDIDRLRAGGVEVRTDRSLDHMHHKFALFDGRLLATGSYNWTRSAARRNLENLLISDDRRFLAAYGEEFERLWLELA